MGDNVFRIALKAAVVFIVYFVTARVGLPIDAVGVFAALVWPPTGIALATMLILGYRYWPGIALAAFSAMRKTLSPIVSLKHKWLVLLVVLVERNGCCWSWRQLN